MKFQLTALACALALIGCADHAARERLGIEDASVLKTGIGALQNEAAGAVNPQWVNTYASIKSSRAALDSLQSAARSNAGRARPTTSTRRPNAGSMPLIRRASARRLGLRRRSDRPGGLYHDEPRERHVPLRSQSRATHRVDGAPRSVEDHQHHQGATPRCSTVRRRKRRSRAPKSS